jgi:pimeloyl-ACP methyl ester carboxylesterase
MVRAPSSVASGPAGSPSAVALSRDDLPLEQTRARYPDTTGFIEREGVRVFYEVYGSGGPTILLLPTWSIIHARFWKMQVADLARRFRVVTFDPRGNGRSDRPTSVDAYAESEFAGDAVAVLNATSTEQAVLVSLSIGAQRALLLASGHPERVSGAIFIGPAIPLATSIPGRETINEFLEPLDSDAGWAKYNSHYWRRDYRGFLEFFFGECFSEPHSTKPLDDTVAWGLETDPESLILSQLGPGLRDRDDVLAMAAQVSCPVLVIHGSDDRIRPGSHGEELASATGGRFVSIEGGGHIPNVRNPVRVNLLIRDFIRGIGRAS